MSYTRLEIAEHAEKIGRSGRTLRRWVLKDCNLDDPVSVEKFLAEAERKKTNVQRYQEARTAGQRCDALATLKFKRRMRFNSLTV